MLNISDGTSIFVTLFNIDMNHFSNFFKIKYTIFRHIKRMDGEDFPRSKFPFL